MANSRGLRTRRGGTGRIGEGPFTSRRQRRPSSLLPARRADLAPTKAAQEWDSALGKMRHQLRCPVPVYYLPVFYEASQLMERNKVPFLLGGGLMVSLYGRTRETKDIDFFVRPDEKNRAMSVLNAAGFFTEETEKAWLLKAEKNGVPVDLIVHSTGMADLDDECVAHARTVWLMDYPFRGFGPEDLLLRKIYSWQDGRPDWWDAVSMVERSGHEMDWEYFAGRIPAYNPARTLSFLLFAHAYFPDEIIPWEIIRGLGDEFFCTKAVPPRGPAFRPL